MQSARPPDEGGHQHALGPLHIPYEGGNQMQAACNQHAISMHSARYTYLFDRAPVAYQFVEGAFEVLKDHLRRPLGIPN